ncbi:hypothetical protein C0Q70_16091 [Pomacea canaliculata]|uniref:EGF-like domain-containing protein n=2 Tax=Pomacea canaliculata TaxID=400727 RepID=A0A2T7NNT5_POMCA|nr:hypothetical protein C0Q70_16091 [Pomacea canaliculata]
MKPKLQHDQSKPCCFNGGLCVLGSFCHCPEDFYGRQCEYKLGRQPCGNVPHLRWVKAGCNLCQCIDGHMACFPRAFGGCDHLPMKEANPWDYKDDMVIFPTDTGHKSDDDYYDDYDTNGSTSSCFHTWEGSHLVWTLLLIIWRLLT